MSSYANNAVRVFSPAASGNAAPIRSIVGASTRLALPAGLVLDEAGHLYVANAGGNSVTVYDPYRGVRRRRTGPVGGRGRLRSGHAASVTLDSPDDLYVTSFSNNAVNVFGARC